ncbi:transposable element Tcb2 transposase [Trichonephila clavipes]|nr:transposable element Tcb2 transposase [Trichonephila clavipes]
MSQRRRLPNSLRWRAVGWMEMGLSQADAARRLNGLVVLFSDFGINTNPKILCPEDLPLSSIRKKILRYYGAKSSSQCSLYARRPVVCVPLNGRQRRNRLCWAREHVSWTQQQWASVLFTDESRFTMESDSGRLLIWREQRTRYHQSNTVERHSYRGGGILVWAGISLGGHTDLHVFHGGTVTGLRYRDEILDPYVRPYAAAIGNDFILMDDNARPHRARIVEGVSGGSRFGTNGMASSISDLNPIEHLFWTILAERLLL